MAGTSLDKPGHDQVGPAMSFAPVTFRPLPTRPRLRGRVGRAHVGNVVARRHLQVRHHVDGALRAATSIPPVSQFTRTSKPVPSRDSTIVPPHDMPVAKKLMVERAGRSLQVRGNCAWKETSLGICKTRPVDPERIMRPGASICALT